MLSVAPCRVGGSCTLTVDESSFSLETFHSEFLKTVWGYLSKLNLKIRVSFQNTDTEVATASIYVGATASGDVPASNVALNRVSWTPSGLHVTVGDDMGKIWVRNLLI